MCSRKRFDFHPLYCMPGAVVARMSAQAFFYPTRLAVALVISVLAVITMCILSIDAIISLRDAISKADASAIRTIFTGVASVQNLFSSTTGQELFDNEINWAYDQVECVSTPCGLMANVVLATTSAVPRQHDG